MIKFIALKDYQFFYYNLLLVFVFLLFLDSQQSGLEDRANLKKKNLHGILLMVLVIFYAGLRPITFSYFGDMGRYNYYFEQYVAGAPLRIGKDVAFELYMKICASLMTAQMFFLTCAFLYIFPLYKACKKMFDEYWYYAFFMLLASFSFWAYCVNGIRNGLATTIFLYAVSRDKKIFQYAFIALAISVHGSLMIPAAAFVATNYYKNTKHYFYFWLMAIPLSIALGGFWENLFMSFGFGEEERLQGYLSDVDEAVEKTGFRWDFILYSASGVLAGWYFIIKKKYEDPFYKQLFNIYLTANGFWILVIRANFSNRFAYLSWFMLGIIIIYPYLKMRFFNKQHQIVGYVVFLYFLFTYIMGLKR